MLPPNSAVALIAALGLILAGRLTAQTFRNLHSFTTPDPTYYSNSDGVNLYAGLVAAGNGHTRLRAVLGCSETRTSRESIHENIN